MLGMCLHDKAVGDVRGGFVFRVKFGEYELEIGGSREEVLKTVGELPGLVANVHKAFDSVKPKTVATLTVKREPSNEEVSGQKFPKIVGSDKCDVAVVRVLETDWGKWRPRTLAELKEALKANGLVFSGSVLAVVLSGLVKKGKVRRWKTDAGYVYILAEKETLA